MNILLEYANSHAIIAAEPDCMKLVDADGVLQDMNPAGLAMIGAARVEQVRGVSVYNLIKPQYHDVYRAALAAGFRGEQTASQFEIVGVNGVHRHVEEHAAPIYARGAPEVVQYVVALTRDVTERVKADAAMRRSARMLEHAQRIAATGSWDWNIVTNDLEWSDQIYRIFGIEPVEFGASYPAFLDRVHPDDRAKVEQAVRLAVQERAPYDIYHRVVRPNGEVRMVRELGEVEYDSAGGPLRMLGVVQDVTEAHRVAEALRLSEDRLSGILKIAPEAVIVTDESGAITMFSVAAEEVFGYSSDEVVGRNVTCLMPEEFRGRHGQHVRAFANSPVQSKRMGERSEIRGLRRSGEEFPALASISRLITLQGIFFTVIVRDITVEKTASRELLEAKDRAERARATALEAAHRLEEAQRIANIGSWEWRPGTGGFSCSEQAIRIFGRTNERLAGRTYGIIDVTHPDDLPSLQSAFGVSFANGEPLDMHHRIVCPDGVVRFVHTQAQVVRDAEGGVEKLIGVVRDLTELRSMQELLEAVKDAGERARAESAAKTDFLSHMSHELRTPLNAIIGYSELLLEEAEAEQRRNDVTDHERIIGAAKHLLKLINGLLDLSKIEAGSMEAEVREFDVTETAIAAIDTVRPTAEANGNRLVLDLAEGLGQAHSDEFRLNQCLLNLLSNAAKFTKHGVITLRGRRERLHARDWLVFEIEDTGIGMSEQQLARLFRPFAQAETSTARTHGGTGLGLAITQRLAQLMGGDVCVQSTHGEGTTFTLRVPADRTAIDPLKDEGSPSVSDLALAS